MSQANSLRDEKKAWRRVAAALSGLTTRAERIDLDVAVMERVDEYVRACAAAMNGEGTLLAFAPLADEPDITPFLRVWAAMGRGLVLPVWKGGAEMILRRVANFDMDLRPGRGGILEPSDDCPRVDSDDIDIAIIPGRFFSESCERLGRGAGCYDKLLAASRMYRIGICYDYQVLPRIPSGKSDRAMDMVVTPSRTIVNQNTPRSGKRSS